MMLHVKGAGVNPTPQPLQAAVASVDASIPVRVSNLQESITAPMGETRTIGALIAAFSGLALLLAAVGLNGLVSYGASQRVREMGIRIALGARPESLIRLVLARGIGIALIGIGIGLGVAISLRGSPERFRDSSSRSNPVTRWSSERRPRSSSRRRRWRPGFLRGERAEWTQRSH